MTLGEEGRCHLKNAPVWSGHSFINTIDEVL